MKRVALADRGRARRRALVAGCMVGPDYERPTVDAPERLQLRAEGRGRHRQHRVVEAVRRPGARPADRRGARATTCNVKVAAANVEQAAGVLTQTRSPLFPQVGYDGSAARAQRSASRTARRSSPAAFRNPQTSYQALAERELGDRPVGPHPAADRVRAREPARHRRGAPRRDPVAGRVGRQQLPARCAGSTSSSRSRSRRSAPTASRCGCSSCSSSTARSRR